MARSKNQSRKSSRAIKRKNSKSRVYRSELLSKQRKSKQRKSISKGVAKIGKWIDINDSNLQVFVPDRLVQKYRSSAYKTQFKTIDERLLIRDKANAKVTYPSEKPIKFDFHISYDSVNQTATEYLRQQLHKHNTLTFSDLIQYNINFLSAKYAGSFYHFGPIYDDVGSEVLIRLAKLGVFSMSGQGRVCKKAFTVQRDDIVVEIIEADLSTARATEARFDKYVNLEPMEDFQKAYICGFMMVDTARRLAERARSDPTIGFFMTNVKNKLLASSNFVEGVRTILTTDGLPTGADPENKDYGFTLGGLPLQEIAKFQYELIYNIWPKEALPILKNMSKNMVFFNFEELRFCETGPQLLDKLIGWLSD